MTVGKQRFLRKDTQKLPIIKLIDTLDFIKTKNFCTSKDTPKKIKGQAMT